MAKTDVLPWGEVTQGNIKDTHHWRYMKPWGEIMVDPDQIDFPI